AHAPGNKVAGSLHLLNTGNPKESRVLTIDYRVRSMCFSPDERYLAIATWQNELLVWKVATGKLCGSYHDSVGMFRLAFTPDSKKLATAGDDGVVRFWDPASVRELSAFRGHTEHVQSVAFS